MPNAFSNIIDDHHWFITENYRKLYWYNLKQKICKVQKKMLYKNFSEFLNRIYNSILEIQFYWIRKNRTVFFRLKISSKMKSLILKFLHLSNEESIFIYSVSRKKYSRSFKIWYYWYHWYYWGIIGHHWTPLMDVSYRVL